MRDVSDCSLLGDPGLIATTAPNPNAEPDFPSWRSRRTQFSRLVHPGWMIHHKQRATLSAENIEAFTLARVLLLRIINLKQNRELDSEKLLSLS